MGLDADEWRIFAAGANLAAKAVADQTGLRTVFHHHCAGYVETPDEIARFLDLTDPRYLGLVFDTGHYLYGAGHADAMAGLERFGDRVWYVHFKDCAPAVASLARANGWDYFTALRHGVFCELGRGSVDFPAVLAWLKSKCYSGYVLVEQDILPGMGTPRESALRNRQYLRSIEHYFA
jgi:inosose dehydratase